MAMPKSPNQKSPQLSRTIATPNVAQFLNLDIKHIKMPTKVFNPVKPIHTNGSTEKASDIAIAFFDCGVVSVYLARR
ncbi:hypothetical protein J4E85_006911 [Alternaria conjuncta]|uniref:uncharacterized protein n=1 Tax=Alternaria conjuncta TaxID=181017 RepID=UPI00221F70AC|nr:uncharacterized protein J4E85_006911 [Alternaria conjuncta]KAI4926617.1 hypothetical protein J4E85_006911 [Alternaria conjuncta]